ncbi:E3 ubiquitin-protein ligase MBR2-like [Impatiens glandulifera]|uniref:E3 ubiquitin-protein ligase MBR2-like n=1 Tax=Impatiens glandulifera TaxID=253017 RepID=UPI001FB17B83|nr:E3 ubiquitin-protein ligase MBR2-like [Impatiens glandulifera]
MQGQRRMSNSFTESVDLNQGSNDSNTGVDQSSSWNNMSGPGESPVPSYNHFARDSDASAVGRGGHTFRGWDFGQSSSGANLQNHGSSDEFKSVSGQTSFRGSYTGLGLEERIFGSSVSSGIGANQFGGRPQILPSTGRIPRPINLNSEEMIESHDIELGMGSYAGHYLNKLDRPETDPSLNNVGTSSGNPIYCVENGQGSGSSLGNWGSSCKRKALEGSSGHYQGGSSSSFQQSENIARHSVPGRYAASTSLNISSPPANSPSINPEYLQYGNQTGLPTVTSEVFSSSGLTGVAESSSRNSCSRLDLGSRESRRFHVPSSGIALGLPDVPPHQLSRPFSFTSPLDPRSISLLPSTSTNPPNQYCSENNPDISRNIPAFTWNGGLHHQASGSFMSAGQRGLSLLEEENFYDLSRNSTEHPYFTLGTELRSMTQDANNRNTSIGNPSSSSGVLPGSRTYSNSGISPFPNPWISHQNSPPQSQRLSELTPWSLFPPVNSGSGIQRGQLPHLRPSSSLIQETGTPSGSNHGHRSLYPRRGTWSMDVADDELSGWHASSSDNEGRLRLVSEIRQVLNAMRRIENFQAEDYVMFDPFINGAADMHDRHRGMRLDVDNMSYEELLALEEQIGNVSTGLNEETIMKDMQQSKFMSLDSSLKSEPCCICQEEYAIGDNMGKLECGHDFHTNCIKKWLTVKNICPICKMPALGT